MHGTFRERVVSITTDGLLPSGLGSGEGRLFVHWSKDALDKPGKHTGVRSGTDAVVITTLGRLKEGKVDMRTGVDGVILTSEVPPRCFDRISMFDGETGKEGDLLWTRQDGLVPIELPTGDTDESSSEDEAEGRQRSGAAKTLRSRPRPRPLSPALRAAIRRLRCLPSRMRSARQSKVRRQPRLPSKGGQRLKSLKGIMVSRRIFGGRTSQRSYGREKGTACCARRGRVSGVDAPLMRITCSVSSTSRKCSRWRLAMKNSSASRPRLRLRNLSARHLRSRPFLLRPTRSRRRWQSLQQLPLAQGLR